MIAPAAQKPAMPDTFQVRLTVYFKDGRVFSGVKPWLVAEARLESAMKHPLFQRAVTQTGSAPAPKGAILL